MLPACFAAPVSTELANVCLSESAPPTPQKKKNDTQGSEGEKKHYLIW